ncbi:hypothetical protein FA13DRAFT_1798038 [Coprinellus micaceus]|uniref:Uncharacterized protein n=1 Tax=Coprinellus micaceus TaxID=71717 RepID=A0A4Y7SQP0_COPMI|nr:hypothetical protein FA13DRAFT_1798038 [Coprinellus micaceus]
MPRTLLFVLAFLILQCLSTMSGPPQDTHIPPLQGDAIQNVPLQSPAPCRLSPSELQPLPPPVRCRNCLELVEFHYCELDEHGNQDRPVAMLMPWDQQADGQEMQLHPYGWCSFTFLISPTDSLRFDVKHCGLCLFD